MFKDLRKEKHYIFITNIYLFIFYLSISFFVPYQCDDFNFKINPLQYSFNLEIIPDLFERLLYWYNHWTGRMVGMFFTLIFLIPKKIYFDIFNSVVQVVLINAIFYISKGRIAQSRIDAVGLFLINIMLFTGFYGYSGAVFNITTSINITWTHTFTIVYFAMFWKYLKKPVSKLGRFGFFIFGIFSGCGLEGALFGQLFFFLILLLFNYFKNFSLPNYTYPSFLGVIIGGLILILSPGNFNRVSYSQRDFSLNIDKIANFFKFEINWFFFELYPLWIISIPLIILSFMMNDWRIQVSTKIRLIFLCGLISSLSLVMSPEYHRGTNIFFFYCLVIFILSLMNIEDSKAISIKKTFFTILLSTFIIHSYLLFYQMKIFRYSNYLEKEILSQKKDGNNHIVVDQIDVKPNRLIRYMALWHEPNSIRNIMISNYYNINQIHTKNSSFQKLE